MARGSDMQAIIDFFTSLGGIIVSAVEFIIGLVQDLIYVIGLLGKFIVDIPTYFGWLPGAVVAIIVSIFAIVLIYKIIGREG